LGTKLGTTLHASCTADGDLIVQFSQKRYRKDKYEFEKQIKRAKDSIAQSPDFCQNLTKS
jgi:hypothetical protein